MDIGTPETRPKKTWGATGGVRSPPHAHSMAYALRFGRSDNADAACSVSEGRIHVRESRACCDERQDSLMHM